ncbi:unnamed protein product [Brassica rapa subsp. narinosa]
MSCSLRLESLQVEYCSSCKQDHLLILIYSFTTKLPLYMFMLVTAIV